jgi:hypothetical protein
MILNEVKNTPRFQEKAARPLRYRSFSVEPDLLRVAFSATPNALIPELFENIYKGKACTSP